MFWKSGLEGLNMYSLGIKYSFYSELFFLSKELYLLNSIW